uniref:Uncharacterized protein n=1 Tax=Pseudomonas graminis TaxID=158627 RepID=A0A7C2AT85_9PSED
MSIPVNALKDDELLHYAQFDPDVAAELQRRFADGSIDPGRESEELRDETPRKNPPPVRPHPIPIACCD